MGQIVIEIPNRKSRRYFVRDKEDADRLIDALDQSVLSIDPNSSAEDVQELAADLQDVRKALSEYQRTKKTFHWEDVKLELGL